MKPKIGVYLLALVAIILWAMSYVWSNQLILLGIPIEYFVFIRILIAGILLLLFNLAVGNSIKIEKKHIPLMLILALCEPLIYFVCETYGIKLTESATYSALIIATTPIFSVFASFLFLKEKVSFLNIVGILICLAGLVITTLSASAIGPHFILGVILLLTAVLSEVGHASCTKSLAAYYKPSVIVMYQFLIGSVYLLPLFLTKGMEGFETSLFVSWDVFRPILFLAVLCSSLAFSLWAFAIKNLGVVKSSIFLAMIPIFTAICGFILGTEKLSLFQWLGIAVASFGLILTQCSKSAKETIPSDLSRQVIPESAV